MQLSIAGNTPICHTERGGGGTGLANKPDASPLTHTHTHIQETHLKSLLFVSVSISLYTSCTTEQIEKVREEERGLQRNDRTKKSVTVSSTETHHNE